MLYVGKSKRAVDTEGLIQRQINKITSEIPVPHSLRNIFNTIRYRSTVSVQSLGYFQSTVSYINGENCKFNK